MEKFFKGIGMFMTVVAGLMLLSVPATWFIMIALGILHDRWEQIPAFGYWETYVVFVASNFVLGTVKNGFKPPAKSSDKS